MRTKDATKNMVVMLVGIILVALLVMTGLAYFAGIGPFSAIGASNGGGSQGSGSVAGCPTDLDTALTLTVNNGLNTTGIETYDNTGYLYKVVNGQESLKSTITDTTAGTATLDCGSDYVYRQVSADGSSGDSAMIMSVGAGDATVVEGGRAVKFTATGPSLNLELVSKQHSPIKIRVYDNDQSGWVYDGSDNDATDFETTGATFKSTTGNTTATAVGASGDIDFNIEAEATISDGDVADLGLYILIDASTSDFQEPTVKFEGSKLSVFDLVDKKESTSYSSYEYVYKLEADQASALIEDDDVSIELEVEAVDGVNPTSDIVIAFATIGAARATSGYDVRYSSVTDASSPAAIYTLQSFTLDLS
ncbi:MAG: hypothetical protein U9R08_03605 [Nanoarchaeota archaeon]|nr:hypothetical protein [Nanoarchaeota archaeon]